MSTATAKKDLSYWLHSIIGVALVFILSNIPPMGPVTEYGMQIGGIFVGLIYLWTFVGVFWPCLFGIVMLGMCDEITMNGMFAAFSAYIPLLVMFCLILCGAISDSGLTVYIGRWFLTRKIVNGNPTAFNFLNMLVQYIVAGIIDPIASLFVLWPAMYGTLKDVGYTSKDKYPRVLTICSFVAMCLGQSLVPFWGGQLVIIGSVESATGLKVNYTMYMLFNIVLSLIIIALMSFAIKYVFRCDMKLMESITVEQINKDKLPPMTIQHKLYIVAGLGFFVFGLGPTLLPQDWAITIFMNKINLVGYTMAIIAFLVFFKINGKPVMDAEKIPKEYFSWDMYLMVVVTVFLSNNLLADETGLKELLINLLMPVLGSTGALIFVVLVVIIGILLTNYATNMIVGVVLVQIVSAIAPEIGLNAMAVSMVVTQAVFVALLSPAASPYAPALHTSTEWTSQGEIMKYGLILIALSAAIFLVIGYPLANLMF